MIKTLAKAACAALSLTALGFEAASAETAVTPFVLRQVSGTRPFVTVRLNGHPFLFMVHANAGFYAMTTHANAKAAGVDVPPATGTYGIERTGKVSSLGFTHAVLDDLEVGGRNYRQVRLGIFEAPQDPPMNGMLGIGWLRASGCFVDYARHTLDLPANAADAGRLASELKARGYVAHPMTFNAKENRYYVAGALDGRPVQFDVGTVADNIVNHAFAVAAGVPLGSPVGQEGGPTGTLVNAYHAQRSMAVTIDRASSGTIQPLVFDFAAYDASATASEQATLGAEFMLARGAVIDFGTGTLYLRP